jgi:hypothetical protein
MSSFTDARKAALRVTGVDISDEVARIITADGVAWIEQMEAHDEPYECPGCHALSLARTALTSAVLFRAALPPAVVLVLAHQACLPSRVYDINTMTVIPQGEITLYAWVADDGEAPHARGLLDVAETTVMPTEGGEDIDLILAGLLDDGMSLMTSPDHDLPACGRFTVELGDGLIIVWRGSGRSRSPWYAGPMDPRLEHWRHMAETEGVIDLAVGSAVVPAVAEGASGDPDRPPDALDDSGIWPYLDAAINAGQVVGARVKVLSATGNQRARS